MATMTHNVNGEVIPFTAEDQVQYDAQQVRAAEARAVRETARLAKKASRASSLSKLEALGLTAEEIKDTFDLSADEDSQLP